MRKKRNKVSRPVENQAIGRIDKKKTGESLGGRPVSALKKAFEVSVCDMCQFGPCVDFSQFDELFYVQ